MNPKPPLTERLTCINVLVLDVDGVLTDGSIFYSDQNAELRPFHVRDGIALRWWHSLGYRSVIISGRSSPLVDRRAKETDVAKVLQGVGNKQAALGMLSEELNFKIEEACCIGDDLPELALMNCCGIAVTVADGVQEMRAVADYVTQQPGGRGAVRETIEWILKAQGRWNEVVLRYANQV